MTNISLIILDILLNFYLFNILNSFCIELASR